MNLFQSETTAEVLNGKEFHRLKKQKEQVKPKLGGPQGEMASERESGHQSDGDF